MRNRMGLGAAKDKGKGARQPGQFAKRLGPILGGTLAACIVALTLLAAAFLGTEEQVLVAAPPATDTAAATVPPASPSPLPATEPARSLPEASPILPPSPSPSPTKRSTTTPSSTPRPSPTSTTPPTPGLPEACSPPNDWETYTVGQGESWDSLAQRFGTTRAFLEQSNCLEEGELHPGDRIYMPKGSSIPGAARWLCGPPPTWARYLVRPADTLSSIALSCGVSIDSLKQANCRSGNVVDANEPLWVPCVLPTATLPAAGLSASTSTPRPAESGKPSLSKMTVQPASAVP
jgi:hypothetical protein